MGRTILFFPNTIMSTQSESTNSSSITEAMPSSVPLAPPSTLDLAESRLSPLLPLRQFFEGLEGSSNPYATPEEVHNFLYHAGDLFYGFAQYANKVADAVNFVSLLAYLFVMIVC